VSITLTEGHEGNRTWLQSLVQCFEHLLTADGRPEKHGDNVDRFIMAEAATGNAHLFMDLCQGCESEKVGFQSKSVLMKTFIHPFEPIVGTRTPVLLDRWDGATDRWRAGRDENVGRAHGRPQEPSAAAHG
jgi:hypothetical protein